MFLYDAKPTLLGAVPIILDILRIRKLEYTQTSAYFYRASYPPLDTWKKHEK